ncbi:MAG: DNA gyrase inhibitor YacG [Acidovorax sp.]|nr:DNA gyrase inhibitor YacG [Acidovorax sp.]
MAHSERDRAARATRIVTCPCCGGDSIYAPSNTYRPFCSERCKQVDLGAWASEDFRMPAEAPQGDAPHSDSHLPH